MTSIIHRGHVELEGVQLGATLTLESGKVALEVAGSGDPPELPERIELLRFTSNSGYFTLLDLFRRNMNMRLGVGSLSTFTAALAFESGYFSSMEEIRSRSWSMHIADIAKIFHVNGIQQQVTLPQQGGIVMHWTIASPPAVDLACPSASITVRLGQHISTSGNAIDGPTLSLSYPIEIIFGEEVGHEAALRMMHRSRHFFSLLMGRVLPITKASVRFDLEDGPHDMLIHGLLPTEPSEKPTERLLQNLDAAELARLLNRWLERYEELGDAIRLHMSALEQRKLPLELRFQIFVQALEALHRRTAPPEISPIDREPVLAALHERGVPREVIDRVAGVLAHAHEPGLRQRLRHYWDIMSAQLIALRPDEVRNSFVERVVATRNHYAHRTDRNDQVMRGADLWDTTEIVKAISHMALLLEVGAELAGIGQMMLNRRFAEFSIRE